MDDVDLRRRRELGAVLRKDRARVPPSAIGIAAQVRRKTPDLRCEEVATLAGVSAVWYTWLEQGRDIQASVDVLTALAEALRLRRSETGYLLRVGHPSALGEHPQEVLPEAVDRLLLSVSLPAFAAERCWNIISFNRAADLLFSLGQVPPEERNPVKMMWRPDAEDFLEDWEALARRMLAEFRGCCALSATDPRFCESRAS